MSDYESWISLESKGSYSFDITFESNTTGSDRTATIYVKNGVQQVFVNIVQPSLPTATIRDIRVDFDVYDGWQKGMRIYADFDVSHLKNGQGRLLVIFYEEDNTTPLNDYDGTYEVSNQVATWSTFSPEYDSSTFTNVQAFIPYEEFGSKVNNAYGTNTLSYDVLVQYYDEDDQCYYIMDLNENNPFTYTVN